MTRSPIELSWTAKNIFIVSFASWVTSRLFYGKIEKQSIITELTVIILKMILSNFDLHLQKSLDLNFIWSTWINVSICHNFRRNSYRMYVVFKFIYTYMHNVHLICISSWASSTCVSDCQKYCCWPFPPISVCGEIVILCKLTGK